MIIQTPSRLHLTLTDLTGRSGRVDGGVGISLDQPNVLLEAEEKSEELLRGRSECRADSPAANAVQQHLNLGGAHITVRGGYKIACGAWRWNPDRNSSRQGIMPALWPPPLRARDCPHNLPGGTSGIGTAAFEMGGFLVDGGHSFGPGREKMSFSPSSACGDGRPAIGHYAPRLSPGLEDKTALPEVAAGADGSREVDVFRDYCPLPEAEVHELCYQILCGLMPAVVEESLDDFGAAVNRIQEIGFKRIEVMLSIPWCTD